jgi:hypothetical protein
MAKISVPVLWNIDSFLNGALMNIDITSRYVTTVNKKSKPYPPKLTPPPGFYIPCLQIEDPDFNVLYLNMPLSAYQAAIRAASGSQAPLVQTKIYSIASTTSTITDPALTGVTIIAVWWNGVEQNITGMYSGDTLTFGSSLHAADTVGVIYYNN